VSLALPPIQHDQAGFEALVGLSAQTRECFLESIELELTGWFDADMCAALGAILYQLGKNANSVHLYARMPDVEKALSRNGFLSHYGRQRLPDAWGTTIPYRRFDAKDDHYFGRYIETHLVHHPEMPAMSPGLIKKFRESVFEVFSNAVLHSRTELGIFSCGQFFPTRKRLNLAIADLGIGIRRNILEHTGLDLTAEQAIVWATKGQNTTKRGPIPGGLGLKLLREFIGRNGGCIQIVSDAGYWKQEKDRAVSALLRYPFPGTVVTLEIDTADPKAYSLAEEISPADVF